MLDPSQYTPDRSLAAKVKRRLTYWRTAKAMSHTPARGIVSFTFDDFPKSAAQHGADILESRDARGTYYACTGMRSKTNIMGEMYDQSDLERLRLAGHEIGAHTFSHLDCSRVNMATLRDEIDRNMEDLGAFLSGGDVANFAWPYGETTYENKLTVSKYVSTARGILPGINRKGSDLMQLGAFELTPSPASTDRAVKAIEKTARRGGWAIIFTHDVRDEPSPFGVQPDALKRLLKCAKDAGVSVLPVSEAFAQIQSGTSVQ
ncbi:MAG: polysaccharide deacetylase family protein [Pseudomonadota bacterium]